MSGISYVHETTTGTVVSIQWSGLGDVPGRKRRFGGAMSQWKVRVVGEAIYVVPPGVAVEKIDAAITAHLLASDRAVVAYPHGKDASGASALRMRFYGKAAEVAQGDGGEGT